MQPFYACYLLRSGKKGYRKHTYVGSTTDPIRRLRQHNGELAHGARATHVKRPWEMAILVYGFPSKVSALKFEWVWQKPGQSRHFRELPGNHPSNSRESTAQGKLEGRVKVLLTMLNLPAWKRLPLCVCIPDLEVMQILRTYQTTMGTPEEDEEDERIHHACIQDLPFAFADQGRAYEEHKASRKAWLKGVLRHSPHPVCTLCQISMESVDHQTKDQWLGCREMGCFMVSHIQCLAHHLLGPTLISTTLLPTYGPCPGCGGPVEWSTTLQDAQLNPT
ncbi:MAG: hypothetical protein DHS80DRAFT_30339 [Piptocephalis tieghemiana]|nr:MAG: hypothetical protein DHS80DRAFT_30339 [Piptocephalis tieghemiana]